MESTLCNLCARRCNINRTDMSGYCKMPKNPVLAKACLHFGEEPCITGAGGSGTVFFSGCSLGCVFCQNSNISHNRFGKEITTERLAEIFKQLELQGAENINLVTPTHFVDAIIDALEIYRPNIPIVYNSSGYDDVKTIKKLRNYIDVYLIDFKYYDEGRALRYSKAENYTSAVKNALSAAAENVNFKCEFNDNDVMTKGLIIRHLIMPQGTNDAINIINWCNENLSFAAFSLMSQYTPVTDLSSYPEINRRITKREYEKVFNKLIYSDFSIIYSQDLSSSTDEMIPDFDLSGI